MNVEETAGATRRLGLMSTVECRFVLRIEGVFSYAPGLAARIDPGELLEPGSPEEVEIRACAISAVERMVEHATRRWRGMAAARGLTESNPSSERGPRARRRPTSSVLAVRRGHGGDLFPSERRDGETATARPPASAGSNTGTVPGGRLPCRHGGSRSGMRLLRIFNASGRILQRRCAGSGGSTCCAKQEAGLRRRPRGPDGRARGRLPRSRRACHRGHPGWAAQPRGGSPGSHPAARGAVDA